MIKIFTFVSLFLISVLNQAYAQFTVYTQSNSNVPSDYVMCLSHANNGDVWVGSDQGLGKLSGSTWTNYYFGNSLLPSDDWQEIVNVPGGNWIGNSNGLGFFDGTTYTSHTSNLNDFNVLTIDLDANGDLWIGTYDGGIDHYDGTTWTNYSTSNSALPHNLVLAIDFDGSGNTWAATEGGGLAKFDGSAWTSFNVGNSGVPSNELGTVAVAPNGDVWVAEEYGDEIAQYDGTTWTIYDSLDYGSSWNSIMDILVDATGIVWFGTSNGLMKYDGSTWSIYDPLNSNLVSSAISELAIDASGYLWMSSHWGGLVKMQAATSIHSSTSEKEITIFPNPVVNNATIRFEGQIEVSEIVLYTVIGKKVAVYPTARLDGLSICAEDLVPGMYLLKVFGKEQELTRKFIVK